MMMMIIIIIMLQVELVSSAYLQNLLNLLVTRF